MVTAQGAQAPAAQPQGPSAFERVEEDARYLEVDCPAGELARIAQGRGWGDAELEAIADLFSTLRESKRETTVNTLLKLSRLPLEKPKTFDNYDFCRLRGKDVEALRRLPSLSHFHAGSNIAFIGPSGVGKTHLAKAYGRECCLRGYKAYILTGSELKTKLKAAIANGTEDKAVSSISKPSCLIIDEVGRCKFDKRQTNLFFDIVDHRYEKRTPMTTIFTSNYGPDKWGEFFDGDSTLLCALDRIFDHAAVFMMRGTSYRGAQLEKFAVEAVPAKKENKK